MSIDGLCGLVIGATCDLYLPIERYRMKRRQHVAQYLDVYPRRVHVRQSPLAQVGDGARRDVDGILGTEIDPGQIDKSF